MGTNKKKNFTSKITMKVFAAALIASITMGLNLHELEEGERPEKPEGGLDQWDGEFDIEDWDMDKPEWSGDEEDKPEWSGDEEDKPRKEKKEKKPKRAESEGEGEEEELAQRHNVFAQEEGEETDGEGPGSDEEKPKKEKKGKKGPKGSDSEGEGEWTGPETEGEGEE